VVVKVGVDGGFGENVKEYVLHTQLLKRHSGFFRATLSGALPPGLNDGGIPFTAHPETFDHFVDWLYKQDVSSIDSGKQDFEVYVLAERLVAPQLKAAVLDIIYEDLEYGAPSLEQIAYAFLALSDHDPLLRLIVDAEILNSGSRQKFSEEEKAKAALVPYRFYVRYMIRRNEMVNVEGVVLEHPRRGNYSAIAWI
jgi:hypothetical protein